MFAWNLNVTGCVAMGNVAVVAPAGTVTLSGIVVTSPTSERVTTDPPLGAGAVSVTVPVEDSPPITVDGLTVSDAMGLGSTVRVAVRVVAP
jgi:hypothetical protein